MCSFGLVLNTDALCVVRCIHVRELLEVRLSVTPISESISEGDKGARGTYELTRVSVFFRAKGSPPVKAVTVAPTILPLTYVDSLRSSS